MAAQDVKALFADKKELQRIVAEQNTKMGFVPDPTATPEKVRAMMRALGIRREDNIFSCGIIAARDEE
jgi:3-mercaptopyruvate sulfurtransferase SseA